VLVGVVACGRGCGCGCGCAGCGNGRATVVETSSRFTRVQSFPVPIQPPWRAVNSSVRRPPANATTRAEGNGDSAGVLYNTTVNVTVHGCRVAANAGFFNTTSFVAWGLRFGCACLVLVLSSLFVCCCCCCCCCCCFFCFLARLTRTAPDRLGLGTSSTRSVCHGNLVSDGRILQSSRMWMSPRLLLKMQSWTSAWV